MFMDAGIGKSDIPERLLLILHTAGLNSSVIADLPREPGVPDVDRVLIRSRLASVVACLPSEGLRS